LPDVRILPLSHTRARARTLSHFPIFHAYLALLHVIFLSFSSVLSKSSTFPPCVQPHVTIWSFSSACTWVRHLLSLSLSLSLIIACPGRANISLTLACALFLYLTFALDLALSLHFSLSTSRARVAVYCSVLQCFAMCCSVLLCVFAVCLFFSLSTPLTRVRTISLSNSRARVHSFFLSSFVLALSLAHAPTLPHTHSLFLCFSSPLPPAHAFAHARALFASLCL